MCRTEELIRRFREANAGNPYRYISSCGRYVYNLAIIDYLQAYDFSKRGEHFLKVWFKGSNAKEISACNSKPYARRFLRFMRENVIINQLRD